MYVLNVLGDFLLSEWLWGVTYGWSYIFLGVLLLTFFSRWLLNLSLFRAFFLSMSAYSFSFFIYSAIVVGGFIHFLQWWYVPHQYEVVAGPLVANMSLGLIHSLFQILFFAMVSKVYRMDTTRFLIGIFLSNALAVVMSYWYLIKFMQEIG